LYNELAKTPERGRSEFIIPGRFNSHPWATHLEDCNGDRIKFHYEKLGLSSRNGQLVVSDILMKMREHSAETVYLYWPYEYNMTVGDRIGFKRIADAVKTAISNLIKRNVRIVDFTAGMMGSSECPGYLIFTSDEQYAQFLQDIGEIMDPDTEALNKEFLYTVMTSPAPYGTGTPSVSTKDIGLALSTHLLIRETPFTPEKFANRLLIDYGYVFDVDSIIRGTKLAKIHRLWSALPPMAGGICDHYLLMEHVIQFCLDHANLVPFKDRCKKMYNACKGGKNGRLSDKPKSSKPKNPPKPRHTPDSADTGDTTDA